MHRTCQQQRGQQEKQVSPVPPPVEDEEEEEEEAEKLSVSLPPVELDEEEDDCFPPPHALSDVHPMALAKGKWIALGERCRAALAIRHAFIERVLRVVS